jgi:predicted TIM-barrel fold metal-dependent hydrolase
MLWQLDRYYPEMRKESHLVKRLPSEYLREHVRVTTQPLEMTEDRDDLIEGLEAAEGIEDILVFSSDYPHWDFDDPTFIGRRLPPSWGPKVFYENALSTFRWPADAKTLPAMVGSAASG